MSDPGEGLFGDLVLGSARGGAKPRQEFSVEMVRSLDRTDVPALLEPPPVGSSSPSLLQIRNTHHLLAKVLTNGASEGEASLITGYSPSRISILKNDPAFRELMAHYGAIQEMVFVDVQERMKTLGLSTLDELQRRMEEAPDQISWNQLKELADMLLVRGRPQAAMASPSAGVSISVEFVNPGPKTIEGRGAAVPAEGPLCIE